MSIRLPRRTSKVAASISCGPRFSRPRLASPELTPSRALAMLTPPRSKLKNSTTSGTTLTAGAPSSISTRTFPTITKIVTRSDMSNARMPMPVRRRRPRTMRVFASFWMTHRRATSVSRSSVRKPVLPRTRNALNARLPKRRLPRKPKLRRRLRRRLPRKLKSPQRPIVSQLRRQRRLPRMPSRKTSGFSRVLSRMPTTLLATEMPQPRKSMPSLETSNSCRARLTLMRLLPWLASSAASLSPIKSRVCGVMKLGG